MQALFASNSPSLSGNSTDLSPCVVERLDVRTKMILSGIASILVILLKGIAPLTLLFAAGAFYLLSVGRYKVTLIAYLAILAMMSMAVMSAGVVALFMPKMTDVSLSVFIVPFIRVMIIMNVVLALALTSKVQGLLSGLKLLKLPYYIYLPAAVMIRFIPSFVKDVKQIRESLKTKGYFFTPVFFFFHPFLTIRLMFVPLVIRALRSADELGVAAELKGVGSSDSIRFYKTTSFARLDYLVLMIACVVFLLAAVMEYSSLLSFLKEVGG